MDIAEVGAQSARETLRWEFHSAKVFERFAVEWDDIAHEDSRAPVLSAVFLASLLKEFGTGRELIAVGYRRESARAMAVLRRKYGAFWETFHPAQSPLGAWVHRSPDTLESIVQGVLDGLPGFALAIGITGLDPELARRPDDCETVTTQDWSRVSRITLFGSFDEFWASRAKNLRNTIKRQRSLLENDGKVLGLDIVTRPADVAGALDDYARLEASTASGAPAAQDHSHSPEGRSYRILFEEFCRRGAGRIYRYRYGNAVVAIDLCIENKDKLIVLKTACDETIGDSSPVSLMRQAYFRNIFDEARISRVEFYCKFMDGTTKWGDEIRTLYHANFYRWVTLSRAHGTLDRLRAKRSAAASPSPTAVQVPSTTAAPGSTQNLNDAYRLSWLEELKGVFRALIRRPDPSYGSARIDAVTGRIARVATPRPAHTVTMYENLSALPARYEPLFSRAGKISLFHTLPWYRNFVQTVLSPDERLRIYAVDTATDPPAARAVLLMRHSDVRAGFLDGRTLSGFSNYYTSLFGPVIEPGGHDMQDVLEQLAAAIASDKIRWDVIDLHPLAVDPPVYSGLVAAFRNAGLQVGTYFCSGNWYLQVNNQTFWEYFDSRTSRLSKAARYYRRNFEASGHFRFELFIGLQGLEKGIADYEAVYNSSWKVPEPHPNFISGLMHTCAEQGWLRLGIAYLDDTPAAAQIWTVVEGTASIYKIAYDERFAKHSLGTVLTSLLMEQVIDVDKVHEVDYLTGDDAYKKDWMSNRRERWGIVSYNLRTPKGLAAGLRHVGGSMARRVIDTVRHRRAGH